LGILKSLALNPGWEKSSNACHAGFGRISSGSKTLSNLGIIICYLLQLVSWTEILAGAFSFSFWWKVALAADIMLRLPTVPYHKKEMSIRHLMSGFWAALSGLLTLPALYSCTPFVSFHTHSSDAI
jgi:hypothetical protein